MIIDDLKAVVAASPRAIEPVMLTDPETGREVECYVVLWHPEQVSSLRHAEARHRYYWNRWVERYNRRAERLGLAPVDPDYEGQVGSLFGSRLVEDA